MSYHTFFKLDIDPFDEEVYDETVNYSAESKYALSNDKACEWDDHEIYSFGNHRIVKAKDTGGIDMDKIIAETKMSMRGNAQ